MSPTTGVTANGAEDQTGDSGMGTESHSALYLIKDFLPGKIFTGYIQYAIINPRRACAARVTVVGSVCLFVCLLLYISLLERLFVPETIPSTQRATKVRK